MSESPPMNPGDTIAAVATPPGEGGVAVIRISGRNAFEVAGRCIRSGKAAVISKAHDRSVLYGHVVRDGVVVDEVMVAVFCGPRSFTAEDTVEISCHGGVLITRKVLETVLAAGARPAQPGEFTMRAFLNDRIDLTQAEAVAELVHARTDLALNAAREQLGGALASRIGLLRDDLMLALAHIEAHIDFPDEDIAPDTTAALLARFDKAVERIDALLKTAGEGRIIREGVRTAIIGRPNVGKSSLLNRLLDHDRAIVSPVAGTTRDTIEEMADIGGIPVVFVDTAGLRESSDIVEQEGIRRSRLAAASAELILHVIDASEPPHPDDAEVAKEFSGRPVLVIANKCDLPNANPPTQSVQVSCTTGAGIAELKRAIERAVWTGLATRSHDGVSINSRHQVALERARAAVVQTRSGLASGLTLELVAFELRVAVSAIGEVVGKTSTEDLLDSIFSQFCLGK